MKSFLITLFLTIFYFSLFSQNDKNIDWQSDLKFLKSELPKRHIDLFSKLPESKFDSLMDNLILKCKTTSNEQIYLNLLQIIAKIGDSHTSINLTTNDLIKFSNKFPIFLDYYKDGYYITVATKENSSILGKKIVKINGIELSTIIDSLSTLFVTDNIACFKNKIPSYLMHYFFLHNFGFAKNEEIKFTVIDKNKKQEEYSINYSNFKVEDLTFLPVKSSFVQKNIKLIFSDTLFESDSIYYIHYNKCSSRELEEKLGNSKKAKFYPSFDSFKARILKTINEKQFTKLVFDVRFNGGGSSIQGSELIEEMKQLLKNKPNIKPIIVIGRKTFSSAIFNVIDFLRIKNSLIIGEETNGKPNHFGEIKSFLLPNSKIMINYSTKKFIQLRESDPNTIDPQVKIEQTIDDYINGIDPIFEWIKIAR